MIGIIIFELFVISYTLGLWYYMRNKGYKNITRKFAILAIGVLLFEFMTEPMFINTGYSSWAYLYKDITWVVTLGWVSIFMTSIISVDYHFHHLPEKKRFWLYLLFIEALTVPIESGLVQTGMRKFSTIVTAQLSGLYIPLTVVPLEGIFAIPVLASLILTFYKYINHLFDTA